MPGNFFLHVVLHSPFSNISQDPLPTLSHPVPHPFLCHAGVMKRVCCPAGGTGTAVLPQHCTQDQTWQVLLGTLGHHTAEERWSVMSQVVHRWLLQPLKCLTIPAATTALTHQSSTMVIRCLNAQNSWQKAEQSILSHWNGIYAFVTAVFNMPHFQVKPSWLTHVCRKLTRL